MPSKTATVTDIVPKFFAVFDARADRPAAPPQSCSVSRPIAAQPALGTSPSACGD